MSKVTPQHLKKLEDYLFESGYEVRYEKGNFKSGYCILELKKLVMVNKFSALETRISSLMEIINILEAQQKIINRRADLFRATESPQSPEGGMEDGEQHHEENLEIN